MKFIELNHYIRNGLVSYPGMPPVEISSYISREESKAAYGEKASAMLDQVKMVNISGTYIDSPYHRFDDGYKIGDIPLERIFHLPLFVVEMQPNRNYFDVDDFEILKDEKLKGSAVLLHSGYDKFFHTEQYGKNTPYLTVEGAQWLMNRDVYLVGIDTPLVDDLVHSAEKGCPVHDIILSNGSVVCEDMCHIEEVPSKGGFLFAIPPRIDMASFPARVFAVVEDEM